jgi:hypothetical protein
MAKMTTKERFDLYHAANPHIYKMYIHFTKELLRLGRRRISHKFVMERIRWEMLAPSVIATPGVGWHVAGARPFKINDHFSPHYARLLIANHPKLADVFEIRALKVP